MSTEEIKQLEKILDEADTMYYTFGASELSDSEYDSYIDRLKKIDPKNKRFKNKKVGAKEDEKSGWEKFSHDKYPMGSQSKVNDHDGIKKWVNKYEPPFLAQEKLDGISIKIIYENGDFKTAATRGDGSKGEDISKNVIKMDGVPQNINIPGKVIVRGEILLYGCNFHYFDGKTKRNLASGISKRLDSKGCEYLNVQVYDIMNWREINIHTHQESIDLLKNSGFDVVNTKVCNSVDDIQDIMDEYIESTRNSLDWDIDGMVIKVDALEDDDWKYPERTVAYKFPNQSGTTKLVSVEWNDHGGRISPVGILEPIDIGGVTIGKATLNNVEHIKRLGIKIGDTVLVSRRNDVIPCIEKVIVSDPDGSDVVPPSHDSDGFPIIRETNSEGKELAYLVSTNPNSHSKRMRVILAWFGAHDCKGIAGATVESIMNAGIAEDLPEFYDMCMNGDPRLLDIDGFGKSTFKTLHKNILLTSKTTLIKFLLGCDVGGFGEKRFISILEHFNKETGIDDFIAMVDDIDTIGKIPGLGMNTAKALKNVISKRSDIIYAMKDRVEIETWKPGKINEDSKINGLSFCFTGKMDNDRSSLEKMVKENGGLIAGVSKKLDYLVTNDPNSGSGKNKKADGLGISKITEEKFLNMVGG